jgi:aryl-phospho-beta-D-glucosidase BglC (GH1 family)
MTGSIIGDKSDPKAATTAQFGAFWGELARRFADNEKVLFGLMNEPHDMPSSLNVANLQAAVNAIRANNATNLIIAPGNAWTGGHYWTKGGAEANSNWMHKLVDPANNLAIDVHEYLDEDFSGSHSECKQDAVTNLAGVTAWLKEHQLKGFITEFGGHNNTGCVKMLNDMLDYMANNDVWIGWTAWAAGPFWGPNSPCCTDQKQLGSFEPGSKAADGGPGLYDTIWKPVIQPKVPKMLQWSGPATVKGGALSARKPMRV